MIKFEVKREKEAPYILVDFEKKLVEISGVLRATLDYPGLYEKMNDTIFKLIEINENNNKELIFNLMILRCNKVTRKQVLQILQKIHLSNINSNVNWYFEADEDEDYEDIYEFEYINDVIDLLPGLRVNIIRVESFSYFSKNISKSKY